MDAQKKQIMEEEGYSFDSVLLCFVNRESGKIFSGAWVDEKNVNTVKITLSLPHKPDTWKIFLNPDQPHEETRANLFKKYGGTP